MHAHEVAKGARSWLDLEVLDAMALLARETGLVVHQIGPPKSGMLERASEIAEQGGLEVSADTLPHTTRIRFAR